MKKISLSTIARSLNCSTVTVFKALSNQQGVGEPLRQKIVKLADELGYEKPVKFAPEKQQNFIYLIDKKYMISPGEQFYTSIYFYLNQAVEKNLSRLHLVIHDSEAATLSNLQTLTQNIKIDGVFIAGQIPASLLQEIATFGIHTVCIDFYSSDFNFDYIYADNYYAGYLVAKYLIKQGHTKIGFVGDIKASNSIADRYFGYIRALNKFGLNYVSSYHCNNSRPEEQDFPEQLPTAYICHCDNTANQVALTLSKRGILVPDNISLIGFDNTELCASMTPPLTSFGIEKSEYAAAAYLLMTNSAERLSSSSIYYKLDLQLNERGSVKKLNNI